MDDALTAVCPTQTMAPEPFLSRRMLQAASLLCSSAHDVAFCRMGSDRDMHVEIVRVSVMRLVDVVHKVADSSRLGFAEIGIRYFLYYHVHAPFFCQRGGRGCVYFLRTWALFSSTPDKQVS